MLYECQGAGGDSRRYQIFLNPQTGKFSLSPEKTMRLRERIQEPRFQGFRSQNKCYFFDSRWCGDATENEVSSEMF
ncbi:hypothetical protein CEXT_247161 [Caerostris extrusa]|uniref:Uncharacterized protein n=1 Tax=Caerostris extrusa TaxID=172846 RepID=A0AAV4T2R9_CAEEX|nr:hypothetical protein CEXT_247161 [Caerostris extrusa]